MHIRLIDSSSDLSSTKQLASQVEGLLNAQNTMRLYEFHVITDPSNSSTSGDSTHSPQIRENVLAVNVQADPKVKSTQASLRSWMPILDVRHNPGRSVDSATLPAFIATEITEGFHIRKGLYLLPAKRESTCESRYPRCFARSNG